MQYWKCISLKLKRNQAIAFCKTYFCKILFLSKIITCMFICSSPNIKPQETLFWYSCTCLYVFAFKNVYIFISCYLLQGSDILSKLSWIPQSGNHTGRNGTSPAFPLLIVVSRTLLLLLNGSLPVDCKKRCPLKGK